MKILLQRVKKASCKVNNEIIGKIDNGLLLFVGFTEGDNENIIEQMAKKCVELRIFSDENGKMNKSAGHLLCAKKCCGPFPVMTFLCGQWFLTCRVSALEIQNLYNFNK